MVPYPVAIGQAQYPSVAQMFQRLAAQVGALLAFDAGALAREAGSPLAVNMVLLGALAATESLPIAAQDILSVIRTRTKEKFLASNLKAFDLGAAAARDPGNWQRR